MATPKAKYQITAQDKSKQALSSATKGLKGLQNMAKGAGLAIAVALGARAFIGATKDALQFADKIDKLNQKLGVNVEFLQGLKFAGEQTGTSFETVSKGLEFMADNTQEAIKGMKAQSDAFKALGVDASKFSKLSVQDQFLTISESLKGVESQSSRINIAKDIFGRAGAELLPLLQQGAEGVNKLTSEFDNLNVTMSQDQVQSAAAANDAMNKLNTAMEGMTNEMAIRLGPTIENVSNFMSENLAPTVNFIGRAFDGLRFVIIKFVQGAIAALREMFAFAGKLPDFLGGARFRGISETLKGIGDSLDVTASKFFEGAIAVGEFNSAINALPSTRTGVIADVSIGGTNNPINSNSDNKPTLEVVPVISPNPLGTDSTNNMADAIAGAINLGAESGVKGMVNKLLDGLKQNFINQAANLIAGAFGGGSGGLGGIFGKLLGFDNGGVVPGPRGAPQLALVHSGETILPTHKGSVSTSGISIINNNTFNTTSGDAAQIRAQLESQRLETIRQIRNEGRRGR